MNTEIESLRVSITEADIAYYNNNNSTISDETYDYQKNTLKKLNPTDPLLKTVGATVNENILKKYLHKIPMGSLEKITEEHTFNNWIKQKSYKIGTTPKKLEVTLSYKMDGISISVEYKNGKIVQALTRGEGIMGQDITSNAKKFLGLPKTAINQKNELFTGIVRCEAVLPTKTWEILDSASVKKTNPRNTANGICARKNGYQSEYIKAIAFRAYNKNNSELNSSESGMLESLKDFGFEVSTYWKGNAEKMWSKFQKIGKNKSNLEYWIDGVVIKINDISKQNQLGKSNNRPRGQIALKYEPETVTSTITELRNTVGHTGCITPTVIFEPTEISGTIVQRATLSNWTIANNWNIRIGDIIKFHKAGEIIPEVLGVVKKNSKGKLFSQPTECPVCSGKVGYKTLVTGNTSARLFCLNLTCIAKKTKTLQNYIQKIEIKGIGDVILESLVSEGLIKRISDLYNLKEHTNLLYTLHIGEGRLLGETRANTILKNIEEKREIPIELFLGSLGIENLGRKMVSKLIDKMPEELNSLESWKSEIILKNAKELGIPNQSAIFHNGIQNNWNEIQKVLNTGVKIKKRIKPKKSIKNSKSFCITGSLSKPKKMFQKMIEDSGNIWKTSVNKELDYLILADKNSLSTKAKKATENGITCINEEDLINLLK